MSSKTPGSAVPGDIELARDFGRRLGEQIVRRKFRVILFGSRARGDADEESDLDLFVELGCDDPQEEVKKAARDIACDLTLKHGILVSVFVADRAFLDKYRGYSFFKAVEAEGVPV